MVASWRMPPLHSFTSYFSILACSGKRLEERKEISGETGGKGEESGEKEDGKGEKEEKGDRGE